MKFVIKYEPVSVSTAPRASSPWNNFMRKTSLLNFEELVDVKRWCKEGVGNDERRVFLQKPVNLPTPSAELKFLMGLLLDAVEAHWERLRRHLYLLSSPIFLHFHFLLSLPHSLYVQLFVFGLQLFHFHFLTTCI